MTAIVVETHDERAVAERSYLSKESIAKLATMRQTNPDTPAKPLAITT